eukprot:8739664-Pyramimonas_sp.AAC.1
MQHHLPGPQGGLPLRHQGIMHAIADHRRRAQRAHRTDRHSQLHQTSSKGTSPATRIQQKAHRRRAPLP